MIWRKRRRLGKRKSLALFSAAFFATLLLVMTGRDRLPEAFYAALEGAAGEVYLTYVLSSGDYNDCLKPARIDVVAPRIDPVIVMARLPGSLSLYDHNNRELVGQTMSEYGYESSVEFETLRIGHRRYCTRAARIAISTAPRAPEIWLSPDLTPDSCEMDAVLKHEYMHIGNFDEYLDGMSRFSLPDYLTGSALSPAFAQRGMTDIVRDMSIMTYDVLGAVDAVHRDLLNVAMMKDEDLDTPESYANIEKSCQQ